MSGIRAKLLEVANKAHKNLFSHKTIVANIARNWLNIPSERIFNTDMIYSPETVYLFTVGMKGLTYERFNKIISDIQNNLGKDNININCRKDTDGDLEFTVSFPKTADLDIIVGYMKARGYWKNNQKMQDGYRATFTRF